MARRRRGRDLDGVLLLDKPKGLSSNQALSRARWLFQASKAGHTGTLDPMATGLLPVCFGEATKFSSYALEADKRYVARVQLGTTTDTGDAEGQVLQTRPFTGITEADVLAAIAQFHGEIDQTPPMYSALKHNGTPLYELARQGIEIKRAPRRINLYHMRLVEWNADAGWFDLDVTCSKGTYIRTLGMDIGEVLGCGAHLTALRRLNTGHFDAEGMYSLEQLEALGDERDAHLLPMDSLIQHLPRVDITAELAAKLALGQRIPVNDCVHMEASVAQMEPLRVYSDDRLLGLVTLTEEGLLAPKRLIRSTAQVSA